MLVHCVLLLVRIMQKLKYLGVLYFWGSRQGQGGSVSLDAEGMRDKLGLEGILELAGVECGSCDGSVDLSYFLAYY